MSRLSEEERVALREAVGRKGQRRAPSNLFQVKPDAAYRQRYIEFTTIASSFFKGSKSSHFEGSHWEL